MSILNRPCCPNKILLKFKYLVVSNKKDVRCCVNARSLAKPSTPYPSPHSIISSQDTKQFYTNFISVCETILNYPETTVDRM